ncbi:MAG: AfsR/SARP family transcriptional regulator, partial [Desulfotomaculales bacterium]
MVRVQMLGRFTIFTPGGEVDLPTAKVRLLTAYLFWQQGRWVRRELLRGMLWDETDEERAAGNLRTALYLLRRALEAGGAPEGLLEIRRDAVRTSAWAECQLDFRVFEEKAWMGLQKETAEVESLMAAATLYRGDFVEDLDADWCLPERRRLFDLHLAVLRALVERLTALNLCEAAVSYASRWLAADPLDEAAHQALMRLYAALGQPARVAEQYEQCRQLLQTELGTSPGEATVRLLKEVAPAVEKGAEGDRKENASGRRRRGPRIRSAGELPDSLLALTKFSSDPLRNARLLLVTGEALALLGETGEGIKSLEKALTFYDRFGGLAAR